MPRIKITHVVGARPNFMKVAPVMAALAREGSFEQMLVHTGQHYDANMSDIFFEQLGMPKPDVNLEVGSGTPSAQTAQIMLKFEDAITKNRPEMVLVYGDVTSTVATALVSVKKSNSSSAYRSGIAIARPIDAGGDQSIVNRSDVRSALYPVPRWQY